MSLAYPRVTVAVSRSKPSNPSGGNPPQGWGRGRAAISAEVRTLAETLLPSGPWTWRKGGEGRPFVARADGTVGQDVSLSHSAGYLAAATVGDGSIGVDVELAGRRERDWRAMARTWLSETEARAVEAEGEDAFLAFWTLREAVAKLGDGGLATALGLDGAQLCGGREGICPFGAGGWVGHRRAGALHLALAWRPNRYMSEAKHRMIGTLDAIAVDCINSFVSL